MKKCLCLLLGILLISGCGSGQGRVDSPDLPFIGSAANLERLLKVDQKYYGTMLKGSDVIAASQERASRSYTDTNVQVQGIDEADIVKTDGQFIYHIVGTKVIITRAWPAESLGIARELDYESFSPGTLYVDDKYLVVIGNDQDSSALRPKLSGDEARLLPIRWSNSTRILVYDKSDFTLVRDLALDGWNMTSRKKDNYLYLINTRHVGWYDQDPELPWFCDFAQGDKKREIGYDSIQYFPDGHLTDYVLFATLDLETGKFEVDAYLGSAQHIYMSHDNLYVAMTDWVDTTVYRFGVDKGNLEFKAKGQVVGSPLNQFSMDEYEGHFRIATSQWNNGQSSNDLTILNSSMAVTGRISDIAPGERIFSARFMGEKGYLVTFEMIDPLFVLDLSDPRDPKILGELKIPGFSTYLHPLDDKHLLGIGRDTEVRTSEGQEFVVELGIKLAIFDVSDVSKPVEKHVEIIGGQHTWSEVLYNHKALFFHQGVLAIPATVTDAQQRDWNYRAQYQGALFYEVDLESGFNGIGQISHTPDFDEEFYYSGISRIIQIDDVYYTVSATNVMAHRSDFTKLADIELPASKLDWHR